MKAMFTRSTSQGDDTERKNDQEHAALNAVLPSGLDRGKAEERAGELHDKRAENRANRRDDASDELTSADDDADGQ